jgi:hypothetical protein
MEASPRLTGLTVLHCWPLVTMADGLATLAAQVSLTLDSKGRMG